MSYIQDECKVEIEVMLGRRIKDNKRSWPGKESLDEQTI